MSPAPASAIARYRVLLLAVAGMGGVLYGYDIGIIGAALLYLDKTIALSEQQTALIVAAVLGGGTLSSLVAGVLADLFGRRTIALVSAVLFLASLVLICFADGFVPLFAGRLLQGLSAGMIAVVIPLYLAECLPADVRGRGTAIFQLLLTVGIMAAMGVGAWFTSQVEATAALGDAGQLRLAQDHAWRWMFATSALPSLAFMVGCLLIAESPRWLLRRGRDEAAHLALLRSRTQGEAETEMAMMRAVASVPGGGRDPLLQRRYVLPFLIACAVLALNQATGINSVLQYVVVILRQAGLGESAAANAGLSVTVVNVLFTLVALALVDRKGRTFLLKLGTAGIIVAFIGCAAVFQRFESATTDVTAEIRAQLTPQGLVLPVTAHDGQAQRLSVLYDDGKGDKLASVASDDRDPVLRLDAPKDGALTIARARRMPAPSAMLGWLAMGFLMLFVAAFALGPGVCVWLALSELMPTRIRSLGMGIALVLNQGVATVIAAVFLPVVGSHGYSVMFLAWALATVVYFLVAAFVLPETKGRTLEEIERLFSGKPATESPPR